MTLNNALQFYLTEAWKNCTTKDNQTPKNNNQATQNYKNNKSSQNNHNKTTEQNNKATE